MAGEEEKLRIDFSMAKRKRSDFVAENDLIGLHCAVAISIARYNHDRLNYLPAPPLMPARN